MVAAIPHWIRRAACSAARARAVFGGARGRVPAGRCAGAHRGATRLCWVPSRRRVAASSASRRTPTSRVAGRAVGRSAVYGLRRLAAGVATFERHPAVPPAAQGIAAISIVLNVRARRRAAVVSWAGAVSLESGAVGRDPVRGVLPSRGSCEMGRARACGFLYRIGPLEAGPGPCRLGHRV